MTKMKRAVVFVFVLVIFYALWKLFSASVADIAWLAPGYTKLQLFLATSIAKFTVGLLQVFGFNEVFQQGRWIMMDPSNGVVITNPCLGIGLYWMFTAFIISYPGKLISKVWFLPLGLFLIFMVHVIRSAFLGFVYIYYPDIFVFSHLYISRGFLFAMTLLFCFVWVQYISRKK